MYTFDICINEICNIFWHCLLLLWIIFISGIAIAIALAYSSTE